eukprot:TRINITY_DN9914_c0_g1_i1.p1 TRINITY_DN9914_c0_g1~~TRINITY_DN9914_c0_g1_i1.p1  ORF type:complete len:753 (-),score=132.11 TRINITY_DN9914_c0_g1_i1:56-2314(-)
MAVAEQEAYQCLACTLLNPVSSSTCEACGAARPSSLGGAPTLQLDPNASRQHPSPKPERESQKAALAVAAPVLGIGHAERKARQEEADAKRQRRDEEKRRILQQFEADRRSRENGPQTCGGGTADGDTSAAVLSSPPSTSTSTAATVTPTKPEPPRSVRLQLRCPQWGRNVIFTCFAPHNVLADVRRCLREELVSGLVGTGDGQIDAEAATSANARVPEEEDIILVESVPPRRRFVRKEDLQMTLHQAGLCPSATLLVDAAPREPPAARANPAEAAPSSVHPPTTQLEQTGDGPGSRRGDDSDASGDNPKSRRGSDDDDESEHDDDDDEDSGGRGIGRGRGSWQQPNTGSGTFGGSGGRPRGQGAQPRFGRGGSMPWGSSGVDLGSGQVLGSASGSSTAVGSTPVASANIGHNTGHDASAGTNASTDQNAAREAREARLAALERRGMGALANVAAATPVAPSIVAVTAANEGSRVAPNAAQKPLLPSADPNRVRGQMGSTAGKQARVEEREAILRELETDRLRYQERHITATETAAAIAATNPGTAIAATSVRLQIRCATTGRVVSTSTFGATGKLSAVRDYAATELGLRRDAILSLAFPPHTEFSSPEQLEASLGDLGLAPTATLLMKSAAKESADVSTGETTTESPAATTVSASAALGAPAAESLVGHNLASSDGPNSASADASVIPVAACQKCPRGHDMDNLDIAAESWCDRCGESIVPGGDLAGFICRPCDFIECGTCACCGVSSVPT